ncbi:MAG: aminotransferase class III-fold pyridoxal phosphate-dependent enzyme [Spirochaetales bacterium]|nr:aminotransferase class III-fold pyridoxal phosphate-dependent enzyme [Spirochaetales bacterium]
MKKQGLNIPRNYNTAAPLAVRAEGIYIYDENDKRYIDGCCGALIANIGYCVPEVVEAIVKQLRTLNFAHPSRWKNEAIETAAEKLAELTPGDLNNIWFVSGGSEAIESALKLARQYYVERDGKSSSKHLFIGRWNSYHGGTLGCMAVAGNMSRRKIFSPLFMEHPKIEPHYCYRCPFGLQYPACDIRCARQLEETILRMGAESIVAFIAEPVVGSTVGALVPPVEYWPLVRDICNRYDILLIADEVMTGMGRTGKAFCLDHWDVVPDIIASAKGMAAGYMPAGGIFVSNTLMDVIKKESGNFAHGHTYNANPLVGAAVSAVVDYIKKHNLIENAAKQGERLEEEIRSLEEIPIVGDLRGLGLMRGVELVADKKTKKPFPAKEKAAALVAAECMSRGLVIYPSSGMVNGGTAGDNFLLAPALTVTEGQIVEIVGILRESLTAAAELLL